MKTKRLHTALLTGTLMCGMLIPAAVGAATNNSAESVSYESYTADNEAAACNVNASIASSFSVEIPKTITLDGASKTANYDVKAKGDIAGNEYISVVPDTSFAMKQAGKTDVSATITQDRNKFRASGYNAALTENELKLNADVGTLEGTTGSIAAPGLTSGDWAGSFNFNIGLKSD